MTLSLVLNFQMLYMQRPKRRQKKNGKINLLTLHVADNKNQQLQSVSVRVPADDIHAAMRTILKSAENINTRISTFSFFLNVYIYLFVRLFIPSLACCCYTATTVATDTKVQIINSLSGWSKNKRQNVFAIQ